MKFTAILCFALCLTLDGYSQTGDQKRSPAHGDSIFIDGNIFVEGGERPDNITFSFWDHWLGTNQSLRAMVDSKGDFSARIFLRGTNAVRGPADR